MAPLRTGAASYLAANGTATAAEAAHQDDVLRPVAETPLWFGRLSETDSTLRARFADVDPFAGPFELPAGGRKGLKVRPTVALQ